MDNHIIDETDPGFLITNIEIIHNRIKDNRIQGNQIKK